MNQAILDKIESEQFRKNPANFAVGDTVRVHTKVVEGDKERIQIFAGVVIGRRGRGLNETFTVRRISYGEGVEGVCLLEQTPLQAPAATAGMSMAEQLAAAWKGGAKTPVAGTASEPYREGELRSFTITAIDAEGKKIRLQPAS